MTTEVTFDSGIQSPRTSGKGLGRLAVLGLSAAFLLIGGTAKADEVVRCAYPYWFGFAPAPVANELGYFKEEGIKFEAVFDNDRANVMPALETGDINCTMRTIGEHMSRPLMEDSDLVVIGVVDVSVGADGVVGDAAVERYRGQQRHRRYLHARSGLQRPGHVHLHRVRRQRRV